MRKVPCYRVYIEIEPGENSWSGTFLGLIPTTRDLKDVLEYERNQTRNQVPDDISIIDEKFGNLMILVNNFHAPKRGETKICRYAGVKIGTISIIKLDPVILTESCGV